MSDFEGRIGSLRVRSIPQEADAFLWDGTQTAEVTQWLGDSFRGWVYASGELLLAVDNGAGDQLLAKSGYLLVRYDDGRMVVFSPNAANHTFEVAD